RGIGLVGEPRDVGRGTLGDPPGGGARELVLGDDPACFSPVRALENDLFRWSRLVLRRWVMWVAHRRRRAAAGGGHEGERGQQPGSPCRAARWRPAGPHSHGYTVVSFARSGRARRQRWNAATIELALAAFAIGGTPRSCSVVLKRA